MVEFYGLLMDVVFFEYPTLCSDPFVGLLNGQTDGQLASSICDNAVVILKWP